MARRLNEYDVVSINKPYGWSIKLNKLDILFSVEPETAAGGVSNVIFYLSNALEKKVDLTYFPHFTPNKSYLMKFFNVYQKFLMKEFDLIHFIVVPAWINGSYMLLKFAKGRGSHTVLNIHGIIPLEHILESEPSPGLISYKALLNTLGSCRVADRVVVNSEYMRANVAVRYGINRDKIVVIPNGVDLKKFNACDDKLVLEGDPAILYLGRLSRIKGVDVLIKAITKLRSELPNMKLHLVGSGGTRATMSSFQLLAKKKGIEKYVVFHGMVPHSMVQRYYKSADICVYPSIHEGFGMVIIEAMASGIPMVASNIGSFREIIFDGKNGVLFKPGDADALSKAILALCQDLDLRKKISQAALKTVIKYSWENIAERYFSLYKYLCE